MIYFMRVLFWAVSIYEWMLVLYGLNMYHRLYLPMFLEDLLEKCCRPYVSLFRNVKFRQKNLALVAAIVVLATVTSFLGLILSIVITYYGG